MENSSKYIGIDESGKGDFFGNLVVAGVIFDESKIEKFKKLNVRDSKKIDDSRVKFLANVIKNELEYEIISISPKKFNNLYNSFKNINKILGWIYSKVISNLLKVEMVSYILIDKFTEKNYIDLYLKDEYKVVKRIEIVKGERNIGVACASIIARDAFLKSLSKLNDKWNFIFPKGAGEVVTKSGVEFAKRFGIEKLNEVAKINFKNYKKILEILNKDRGGDYV